MFVAQKFAHHHEPVTDILSLTHEERVRSRSQVVLPCDAGLLIDFPKGTVLKQGDKLTAEDGTSRRVIEIMDAHEHLTELREYDGLLIARAAYHLGNRHVALDIQREGEEFILRLKHDHVLEAMLEGLGLRVTTVSTPFRPEGGAYSGHGHSHEKQTATIHEFG